MRAGRTIRLQEVAWFASTTRSFRSIAVKAELGAASYTATVLECPAIITLDASGSV